MTDARTDGRGGYWELDDSLGYLARRIFRSFSALMERQTLEHGTSASQWILLRQLWHKDGINQHELSKRVGRSEATITIALRKLEKSGLVRRQINRANRRETLVYLTPQSSDLEAVLMPISSEIHALATEDFSPEEVDLLRNLLLRVLDNLSAETAEPIPHTRGR